MNSKLVSILLTVVVFQDYWILNSPMQTTIILLVEQIVTALGGEFKVIRLKFRFQFDPPIVYVVMTECRSPVNQCSEPNHISSWSCLFPLFILLSPSISGLILFKIALFFCVYLKCL